MEVYALNSDFIAAIKAKIPSVKRTRELLGFDIRNILHKNKTISKERAAIIKEKLNITVPLELINTQTELNLKQYAEPRSLKIPAFSSQLAEFFGIMLGDGNIYENTVRVTLDSKEDEYANYVCNLFDNLFGFKFNRRIHNKSEVFLVKTSRFLKEFLIANGLKSGHKVKNQVGIPEWILSNSEFMRSCLRGLIDTDGCVFYCVRDKSTRIVFKNHSQQLLKDTSRIGNLLELPFVKAGHNSIGLYRKMHVERYIKQVGTSNYKNCKRLRGCSIAWSITGGLGQTE